MSRDEGESEGGLEEELHWPLDDEELHEDDVVYRLQLGFSEEGYKELQEMTRLAGHEVTPETVALNAIAAYHAHLKQKADGKWCYCIDKESYEKLGALFRELGFGEDITPEELVPRALQFFQWYLEQRKAGKNFWVGQRNDTGTIKLLGEVNIKLEDK